MVIGFISDRGFGSSRNSGNKAHVLHSRNRIRMHNDSRSQASESRPGAGQASVGGGHGLPPSQRARSERNSSFLSSTSSWATASLSAILGKSKAQPEKMSITQAKLKFELAMQEFSGQDADRLRYRIRGTRDVRDLWYLRSDMHSLISKRLNQAEASERINQLLPCFDGWIPEHQLTKI
jgi:hypothetical protein